MADINFAEEKNTTNENKVIENLTATLHIEKEALQKVCSDLQTDHSSFESSISSQFVKLQEDPTVESRIMDELALETTRVRMLSMKLTTTNIEINILKS
ncbi:unnamed protein product [Lactuca saligna]|uniref:Uncharacterized protein n=1 Tax=Lactuca saligna TaxID=75948 RepID=A0AA35YZK6_LACSI|nr:unnamed protein product [Lactuca saligna]